MTPRYFTGQTLFDPVRETQAANFKDLVDRHINLPVALNITRENFQKLPKDSRDKAKSVAYLVAACFQTSPSERVYTAATHCNLLFLDIDTDKDGSSPAAPFVRDPSLLARHLAPFSFAAYTTASSTTEAPRIRVVVAAEAIPLSAYPAAVRTIAGRMGLRVITPESRTAVQPMYLPTTFAGQDPDEEHPLFASDLTGIEFTVADIDPGEPGAVPQAGSTSHHAAPADGPDGLEYLRPPVPEITLDVAKEALDHVDPDVGYREWIDVAAALKHQFLGDDTEAAFQIFDEWSSRGAKYKDEDETRAKWDSFQQTSPGRVPVTIRSLLHLARESGWDCQPIREACFSSVMDWLQNNTAGQSALLAEGLKRIMAAPLLSQTEEDALLNLIVAQSKEKHGLKVSATSLRKDLKRLKDGLKEKETTLEKQKSPAWCKGVCFVATGSRFFRQRTGERYTPDAWDYVYGKRLLPTADQLKESGQPITPANLSRPMVRPRDYALNHIKIPTVYDMEYDPSSPNEIITVSGGRVFVNTYVRSYPQADPAGQADAEEQFMGHLYNLLEEKEHARTLMDFLAYMVQHPGKKIRWAVLLQGVDGCGKGFIADTMAVVLGSAHVESIAGKTIFSGWTEWATGHQLVAIEEIRVVGVNRHEVMGILKPLITNTTIPINQKFADTRQAVNRTNYLLFTNHHDALALTPGDRRYFVLKSRYQTKEQVQELTARGYHDKLYAMLEQNPGGLRAFFESWEISEDFNPNASAPETKYLLELISDSANETTAAVRQLICEGDHPLLQYDLLSSKILMEFLQDHAQLRSKVSTQHLYNVLREENYTQTCRIMIDGCRHYLWSKTGAGVTDPEGLARLRVEKDLKNLCLHEF